MTDDHLRALLPHARVSLHFNLRKFRAQLIRADRIDLASQLKSADQVTEEMLRVVLSSNR